MTQPSYAEGRVPDRTNPAISWPEGPCFPPVYLLQQMAAQEKATKKAVFQLIYGLDTSDVPPETIEAAQERIRRRIREFSVNYGTRNQHITVTKPGEPIPLLVAADFAAIERRVLAHMAEENRL